LKKFEIKFSAKSLHVLPNFRLEETPFLKSTIFIFIQIKIYKKKIILDFSKKIINQIFSKISARVAQFQTRRNTVFKKYYFYFYTNKNLQENNTIIFLQVQFFSKISAQVA
jgi:hypothetical protein